MAKKFNVITILISIFAIVLLGFIAWRVWETTSNRQQDHVVSYVNSKDDEQLDTTASTNYNKEYVVIEEWGVRFKLAEDLAEVEYFKPSGFDGADVFTFTTAALADADSDCSSAAGNIVMGVLQRANEQPEIGLYLGHIGGYHYNYQYMQAACSSVKAVADLQANTANNMLIPAIKTLQVVS